MPVLRPRDCPAEDLRPEQNHVLISVSQRCMDKRHSIAPPKKPARTMSSGKFGGVPRGRRGARRMSSQAFGSVLSERCLCIRGNDAIQTLQNRVRHCMGCFCIVEGKIRIRRYSASMTLHASYPSCQLATKCDENLSTTRRHERPSKQRDDPQSRTGILFLDKKL